MFPSLNLISGQQGQQPVRPLSQPAMAPAAQAAPVTRSIGDIGEARRWIYDDVLKAANSLPEVSNTRHALRLSGVEYIDPEDQPLSKQKAAILGNESMGRRMRGTWELVDRENDRVLDSRKQVIGSVPYLTPRGTFIDGGTEYVLRNQNRLMAGSYTRRQENGELETHLNVIPGKGVSHRYHLDPEKSAFYMTVGQAKLPLFPLLKAMGVSPRQLKEAWGNDLYTANSMSDDAAALKKYEQHFLKNDPKKPDARPLYERLAERFGSMELDDYVTNKTLGSARKNLDPDTMLEITKKLLAVSRGEADVDDRDALHFQKFFGPEDLLAERLSRDHGGLRRSLLWKASAAGNLQRVPSSALKAQLEEAILGSGLGQAIEQINPTEILDRMHSVTRLGEGGIPSIDAVPDEARSVQPSHQGFIDPIRTPESFRVGVDLYLARNARKGKDGQLYATFRDVRTGENVTKSTRDIADSVLASPDVMEWESKRIPVMRGGRMGYAKKDEVDFTLPDGESMFSPLANLIPFKANMKQQRLAMASRMYSQALPLVNAEAPLVQNAMPGQEGKRSFEEEYASNLGTLRAKQGGQVIDVKPGVIRVQHDDGTKEDIETYENFPFNRKTYLHQDAVVQPGQRFKAGDLLARSNYTDKQGTAAIGLNARTAYIPWKGLNFEDAIVVSEGFAKRATSQHMYQHDLEFDDTFKKGKRDWMGLFGGKLDKRILSTIDDDGVVKPGTKVEYGQPLILAAKRRVSAYNKVHRKGEAGYSDVSVTWEHADPGVVTDVVQGKKGPVVLVKSENPMQVGDKLSGRYGDKGVVAAVIPDHLMPQGEDNQPFEVLLNPAGIPTRTNPAQKLELWLGKLAKHRGSPVKVADFDHHRDALEWTRDQLRGAGLRDTESLLDPERGTKIKDIATGNRFFMKLHHTAESKEQARDGGGYTQDDAPARGGKEGSKRLALLDMNALLSHGAVHTARDASAVRAQRRDDFWLQFMSGGDPHVDTEPTVYKKFLSQLPAAGINVRREGTKLHIMALTNKDVMSMAGDREITSGETVKSGRALEPIAGGLFDKQLTGGHGGNRWSAIKLAEPLPNPVMEEPIRRMLGLTKKEFEATLSGQHKLEKHGTGPAAIAKALESINVDKEIELARAQMLGSRGTKRDQAIRRLGYLKSAKAMDLEPKDWVLDRAPVLPPVYRPISLMQSGAPLSANANYLYKELTEANDNLREMGKKVGGENVGDERLAAYQAFKAVTGLGDPLSLKLQEKQVHGILKDVFGSSPKFGTVQRKLIGSAVDNVGRSVIIPNPDLDMDSVGIPEESAFKIYTRFLARRLRRQGMPLTQALQNIRERTPLARKILTEEMGHRPVFINRAPVLHKFGIMAFWPKLVNGDAMQVSPTIVKGFNADFDGDAMQFHVPMLEDARKEMIERMLPSRNLLSLSDFNSPMHAPANEYVAGLYHATSGKSKRQLQIFRNIQELREAHARGSVNLDDPVKILEK